MPTSDPLLTSLDQVLLVHFLTMSCPVTLLLLAGWIYCFSSTTIFGSFLTAPVRWPYTHQSLLLSRLDHNCLWLPLLYCSSSQVASLHLFDAIMTSFTLPSLPLPCLAFYQLNALYLDLQGQMGWSCKLRSPCLFSFQKVARKFLVTFPACMSKTIVTFIKTNRCLRGDIKGNIQIS